MRKVKFEGWIIFDEDECRYDNPVIELDGKLFNMDGIKEWDFFNVRNEEVDWCECVRCGEKTNSDCQLWDEAVCKDCYEDRMKEGQ